MAADGNTAVVGADTVSSNTGAAYVFTNSAGTWSQSATLQATGGAPGDSFGRQLAMTADGNMVVVGAYGVSLLTGAAYVFTKSANTWSKSAVLQATGGANYDAFGNSVAVDVFTKSAGNWRQSGILPPAVYLILTLDARSLWPPTVTRP